jgi:hypothetical protein
MGILLTQMVIGMSNFFFYNINNKPYLWKNLESTYKSAKHLTTAI